MLLGVANILQTITLEELENCVKKYAKEVENTDKQYIKHGDTFFKNYYADYLNRECDEIYEVKVNKTEQQLDRIIKLLEEINFKLDKERCKDENNK